MWFGAGWYPRAVVSANTADGRAATSRSSANSSHIPPAALLMGTRQPLIPQPLPAYAWSEMPSITRPKAGIVGLTARRRRVTSIAPGAPGREAPRMLRNPIIVCLALAAIFVVAAGESPGKCEDEGRTSRLQPSIRGRGKGCVREHREDLHDARRTGKTSHVESAWGH